MKLRDEMKVTIASYKNLYDCSVTLGIRKQRQAEEGMNEMKTKIKELERRQLILTNQVPLCLNSQKMDLSSQLASMLQSYEEIAKHDDDKNNEEEEFLKSQNKMLQQFLQEVKSHGGMHEAKLAFKSELER